MKYIIGMIFCVIFAVLLTIWGGEMMKCESDGAMYTSNPPKYRCEHCREWWFCKDETPECKEEK